MRPILFILAAATPFAADAVQPPRLPEDCVRPGTPPVFGCSNAANLRTMADPADLAKGRALTPASAMLDASAIERLRTDKTKPLMGTGATDNFQTGGGPR